MGFNPVQFVQLFFVANFLSQTETVKFEYPWFIVSWMKETDIVHSLQQRIQWLVCLSKCWILHSNVSITGKGWPAPPWNIEKSRSTVLKNHPWRLSPTSCIYATKGTCGTLVLDRFPTETVSYEIEFNTQFLKFNTNMGTGVLERFCNTCLQSSKVHCGCWKPWVTLEMHQ